MDKEITIAVVISRPDKSEWIEECKKSIDSQIYRNIEVLVARNDERGYTIGKCYNDLAAQAKGEWILYVNDDDFISPDYTTSLLAHLKAMEEVHGDRIVNVTSFITYFKTQVIDGKQQHYMEHHKACPIGMWRKSYLEKQKFEESLTRKVDSELFARTLELGYIYSAAYWCYGYYYRIHAGQVSGEKMFKYGDYAVFKNTKEIKNVKESKDHFTIKGTGL